MFYPGLVGAEAAPTGIPPVMTPRDIDMSGMMDDGILGHLDPLSVETLQADHANASLDETGAIEALDAKLGENSLASPATAAYLMNYHSSQNVGNSSSTLTEFTKRRNWATRIVDELCDLLQILNAQGRFTYLSPSSMSLLGYNPEDLVGRYIVDYIHEDDNTFFQKEFNESIASGNQMRCYYRFRRHDETFAILEANGHPHFAGTSQVGMAQNHCAGFFLMTRAYPTKSSALLDSFLEHKMENERLTRRVNELRREEAEEEADEARRRVETSISEELDAGISPTTSTPLQPRATTDLITARKSNALTRQNLSNATACDEPDSIRDKMARYEGGSHVDAVELLTGLEFRAGERSFGVSTGCASPMLMPGAAVVSARPVEQSPIDKKKKNKAIDEYVCTDCGTLESPEWRKGPTGPKSLCNACGLRWAKKEKRAKTGP